MDKNNKIISRFVLFFGFFGHFESLAFFQKWGTNITPKLLNRVLLVNNFSKVQQLFDNVSKNVAIFTKK